MAAARPAERGFTLVELMIAIAIVAVLAAAVMPSVASLSGADARKAAGELSGSLRYLFDTAALRHATCRMALDLDGRAWRAECAPRLVGVARGKAEELDDEELARRFPGEQDADRRRLLASSRFGAFSDSLLKKRELSGRTVIREVRVEGRQDPITEGTAYVHFFPGGQAERAFIEVADGDTLFTVVVEPYSGRSRVVTGQVKEGR